MAGRIDRRTLLKGAAATTATMAGVGVWLRKSQQESRASSRVLGRTAPNILVILVDEMRYANWYQGSASADLALQDRFMPNLARLRNGQLGGTTSAIQKVASFEQHFTAASVCSPARSTLVTGLYSHQTGCLVTLKAPNPNNLYDPLNEPILDPGLPTWGTHLRWLAQYNAQWTSYATYWFGKWHLSYDEKQPTPYGCYTYRYPGNSTPTATLQPYGFNADWYAATCPFYFSPNGSAGDGLMYDPAIASEFVYWLNHKASITQPWCTTVSLVNPHDIASYYLGTQTIAGEGKNPGDIGTTLPAGLRPPNFETSGSLASKPSPQLLYQSSLNAVLGVVPDTASTTGPSWSEMLNLYLQLHQHVDNAIGTVLNAVSASPFANNTIIIFTADHGEYAGAHGLRGKGGSVYDEAFHVPLYINDPTGFVANGGSHYGLTSSVDIVPLLLTLATGDDSWRTNGNLSYLVGANTINWTQMLAGSGSPGRPYVIYTTDEEFHPRIPTPKHIIGYRTALPAPGTSSGGAPPFKLGLYRYWTQPGSTGTPTPTPGTPSPTPTSTATAQPAQPPLLSNMQVCLQEIEGYDYGAPGALAANGQPMEVTETQTVWTAGSNRQDFTNAINQELRRVLPPRFWVVQSRAFAAYWAYQANKPAPPVCTKAGS